MRRTRGKSQRVSGSFGGNGRFLGRWRGVLGATLAVLLAAGGAGCVSGGGGGVMAETDLTTQDISTVRGQYATVYDFLKAHAHADFTDLGGTSPEILTVWGRGRRSLSAANPLGALLFVDEEEVPDPVSLLRQMPMENVARMQILRASQTSARFGGDGRRGAVAIWTTGN